MIPAALQFSNVDVTLSFVTFVHVRCMFGFKCNSFFKCIQISNVNSEVLPPTVREAMIIIFGDGELMNVSHDDYVDDDVDDDYGDRHDCDDDADNDKIIGENEEMAS